MTYADTSRHRPNSALHLAFSLKAAPGFEPGDKGFADLCLTTWLCRRT